MLRFMLFFFHDDHDPANWKVQQNAVRLLKVDSTLFITCCKSYVLSHFAPEETERKKENWNVLHANDLSELTNALAQGLFQQSNEHPQRTQLCSLLSSLLFFFLPVFLYLSLSPLKL